MKIKTVLAAGYVRDLLFCSQDALEIYLYKLDHGYSEYKILDRFDREDGSVIIRILQQYNSSPLIKLYDNL